MINKGTVRTSTRGAPTAPRALTTREREALRLIADSISQRGFQPSYREISAAFGWKSPNATKQLVDGLKHLGVVLPGQSHSRAIQFKWKEWVTQ